MTRPPAGPPSHRCGPAHRPRPGARLVGGRDAAPLAARGLAPASAWPAARRPPADLVALDTAPARRVLGRHARRHRHRAARPAHDPGGHRAHLRPRRHAVARGGQRLRRPGPCRGRTRPLHGLEARGARGRPGRDVPRRLGGAGRRLAGAGPRLALRGRLHLWHDGRPEGRAADPRQHPRVDGRLREPPRAAPPARRLDPAAVASLRAGARALLRHRRSAPRCATSARATRASSSRPCGSCA